MPARKQVAKPATACAVRMCDARLYLDGLCLVHWSQRRDRAAKQVADGLRARLRDPETSRRHV